MRRRHVMTAGIGAMIGAGVLSDQADAASGDVMSLLRGVRLVRLSHLNDPATTSGFPGDPEFTLETAFTIPADGFYLQYVKEGEHTGTHWGAPGHMNEDQVLADQMDPGDFLLPAVRVDVRVQAAGNADYAVTVKDLRDFERRHGPIPSGAAICLWTGWSDKWGTPAYANLDADDVIHQPGFSLAAAEWLVEHGKLAHRGALGTDTFGPDRGIDDTYAVSKLLYHEHRISLENLTNLAALPPRGAAILVGGVVNRRGSGSPATIYGLLPR